MKSVSSIAISFDHIEAGLKLYVDARQPNTLFDAEGSAVAYNEARFQLVEGCFYDFTWSHPAFRLGDIGANIITPHQRNPNMGTIAPNIFVGTLSIPIYHQPHTAAVGQVALEVQSVKSSYRDDYRDMLAFITEKCTDLLLQSNAPAVHYFDVDIVKTVKRYTKNLPLYSRLLIQMNLQQLLIKLLPNPLRAG